MLPLIKTKIYTGFHNPKMHIICFTIYWLWSCKPASLRSPHRVLMTPNAFTSRCMFRSEVQLFYSEIILTMVESKILPINWSASWLPVVLSTSFWLICDDKVVFHMPHISITGFIWAATCKPCGAKFDSIHTITVSRDVRKTKIGLDLKTKPSKNFTSVQMVFQQKLHAIHNSNQVTKNNFTCI